MPASRPDRSRSHRSRTRPGSGVRHRYAPPPDERRRRPRREDDRRLGPGTSRTHRPAPSRREPPRCAAGATRMGGALQPPPDRRYQVDGGRTAPAGLPDLHDPAVTPPGPTSVAMTMSAAQNSTMEASAGDG